ncbi:RNA polymerase sigma factor [Phytohabitans suffuscus]|uniref:DNA-directed RNA polymerase sigma-70 factor n=1 Tax=Phytohabitans suffuscus TaxID=624315 RepID=A0A6F8YA45_9ACTN|nr:RNA polymerase sigma factor [Phytohabitans suffuscus]BCB82976.1 DNA-directed RNA polymerase sigma-70 factor [Phytohabitans suffuscus]
MRRSRERGEEWFTALYVTHYSHVVKYALRRLADLDASIDLAQEVFVVAWRRRVQVPDHGLPWLYGVARRLLANHWRARRSAPTVVLLTVDGGEYAHAEPPADQGVSDRLAAVRAALGELSYMDQEILRLVGWEELTVSEAATVLGCRRATAAVRLHRARRRLSEALRSVSVDGSTTASARL